MVDGEGPRGQGRGQGVVVLPSSSTLECVTSLPWTPGSPSETRGIRKSDSVGSKLGNSHEDALK